MLKQKAKIALGWSALDQAIQQGLLFAISVTLARLVAPETYGTVALLQFFTGIAGVFVDGGLSSALIQKNDTTHTDESTVFWFNLAAGALLGIVLFACAPWISRFYGIPVLLPITRLYSLQFFLAACNSVQNTLYSKHLDFKTPLKIATATTLVSAAIGIYLAWKGCQIWALVAQSMAAAILQTVLIWTLSSWRPALTFSPASFRTLFRYSGYLFLSSLLDSVYQRCYTLIIGKIYGVRDLGIYNRADATKQLPTSVLTGILSKVAFPLFSQAAGDLPQLRRGFRLSIRAVMFLNIPIMLGVAVVSEPLILTLFGPVWASAVPLLQILAIGSVLWPLHVLNLSVLKALGHSNKFFKVELIKKSVGLTLVVIGSLYGMQGMALAVVISSVFSFTFNAYYNGKLLDYGAWRQIVDFSPALLCGCLMAVVVITTARFLHFAPLLQLLTLTSIGAASYFVFASLFRVTELSDAIRLTRISMAQGRL